MSIIQDREGMHLSDQLYISNSDDILQSLLGCRREYYSRIFEYLINIVFRLSFSYEFVYLFVTGLSDRPNSLKFVIYMTSYSPGLVHEIKIEYRV